MKSFVNFLLGVNAWLIFVFSVAGAVVFSILMGLAINAVFYDGSKKLLMLGAVAIPVIDAPIFIVVLIVLIQELRKSRAELDDRVAERTKELEIAYNRLREETRERKEIEKRLLHAHKMESIGTLAGGIAHDFNNILTAVLGYTELALDDVEQGSVLEENLRQVYNAGRRAKDLVRQILTFARQADEEVNPIFVGPVTKEALKFLRSSIPSTIEIKSHVNSDSLVMGDAISLHQILMNLCTNAAHAMEGGGVLEVGLEDVTVDEKNAAGFKELKPGDYVKLTVTDSGPGIPRQIIQSIFEPYFTTKAPGEGTGMGLAMVHGIVKRYGGEITVESAVGEGSTFSVFLPVSQTLQGPVEYRSETLPTGDERILFVDDEPAVADMASHVMGRLGYRVTTKTGSLEALEIFSASPDDFDIVITDMTMPDLTGDKLAKRVMEIRPDIPIILCTGYNRNVSDDPASFYGVKAFLHKPVLKGDLAKTVRKVLDGG